MLLDKIKNSLRIDDDVFNEEISDDIEACKADLKSNGVTKIDEDDPLILRAIKVYCRADFATNDSEAERYKTSYEMLRDHLSLSIDYTGSINENNSAK